MSNSKDIVQRLREFEEGARGPYTALPVDLRKLLDAYEALEAEVKRLREALAVMADITSGDARHFALKALEQ
jgi:hypothetical protein